ncbi:MAG: T9SS type A sorting domain-containing protein, partial [Cryomorphaceae bacterium]|nr:T9SS type A sorting domain-containing protein [Cryomorphaceae bacterium]
NLVAPTATDNCDDNVEITPSVETIPGDCPNSWTEVYTWTATDNCGNQSARTFTVNYEDTTAPTFNESVSDITVECDAVPALPVLTAQDNCDDSIEVLMSQVQNNLDCGYEIIVTYTAIDACGNENQVSFTMTVVDTTAPYVISAPADVTIECGQPEPTEVPSFGDNCDSELEPFAISGISNVTECGYTIERTWGVTDDCGNTTSVSQTITVIDTTAPELEGVPADVTVNCEEIPAPAAVTATDACDTAPVVVITEILGSGCPYTIVRTWTATDACGNESEMSQTITVIDNIAPVLVGVPADYSGECGLAPSPADVIATDNCSGSIAAIMTEEVIGDSCPLTIIRTWTATDNCGNSVSESHTITINDETAPVFTSGPADETVECDMVPAPATDEIVVVDNCDLTVDVALTEVVYPWTSNIPGTNYCGYVIERVWSANDDCGNQSSYLQTIYVIDTTAPTLTGVPSDVTVECTNVPAPAQVGAVDNCYQGVMTPSMVESITELSCGYIITRTWTVADDCGNMSSASQEITVVDTQAPYVLTTPDDVTVECDQAIPASLATFGDACDDMLDVQVSDEIVTQDCQYYIIRTWTATDDCGNAMSTSQNIFVVDNTDPILVGVPASMEVQCSDIPAPAVVTATDNCDANVVAVYSQSIGSGNCPYTITRTWTATDDCGNTVSSSQILTVIDTIDPVLVGVPADATVECTDIPAPAVVNATDNCADDLDVSFNESMEAADCGYVLYRTWTVYDNCGNMDEATQVLTVVDTEAPFVTFVPADMSIECDEQAPYVAATFADACDDLVEVGYSEQVNPGNCENSYTLVRTWTAIDDCGNEATAEQTITVTDTTNPVLIGVPAETTVECDQIPAPADVTADDNCDSDVYIFYAEVEAPADCGYVITRTWTATDNCGNSVSESQIVNVVDTTAPVVIFNPEDITIECDEDEPVSAPIFDDNCDDILTIYPSSSISPNDCGYSIERVWTAVDDCGNSVTASQTITVVDTTNPELIGTPADATVQCSDIPAPAVVTAIDNCDDDMEVLYNEVALSNGCPYTIERTWTVYDNCGNMDTYTQVLSVVDTIVPVLNNVPEDGTAECDNIPVPAVVTATDNCSDNLVVIFEESIEMFDCGYDITRTWSVTDECGNYVSASQVINVLDNTEPILIGVPEDATAECDNIPAVAIVSAEDNCSTDLEVQYSVSVQDLACGSIITRTWTVADACGNSVTASQEIEVIDTTAPVIVNGPQDLLVECSEVPGAGVVIAEDNCDNLVDVTMVESSTDLTCGYEITRVWTATDNCGNSDTHTQVITVTDVTAPVILGVPADITIECGEAVPAPGEVLVDDNCDAQPTVSTSEVMVTLDCGYQIVRTYTAVDACGNSSSAQQTITVTDTVDPVFVSLPQDITVNCDEVTIAPSLMATDNCDEMVQVTLSEVVGEGCPYTITRTWTAIDDCGNTAVATQIVTVIDEEAPVWDAFPLFISLSCELVDAYTITASDNCDSDVEVTIIDELLFSGGCLGTLQRTYKATDNCGNFITATQLIQRVDVTAPMIFNVPEDIELTCGDEIPAAAADIFGADNCTSNVEITFEEIQTNEFCPYEIIRTWTAIDDCGNATEGVQVITVTVETPPIVNLISFPNPFDDKFTVEFSVPSDAKVVACVYDMIGKEVMPIFQGDVDANRLYTFNYGSLNWEAGTYIIMMVVDDQVYHHKMIVTHK